MICALGKWFPMELKITKSAYIPCRRPELGNPILGDVDPDTLALNREEDVKK